MARTSFAVVFATLLALAAGCHMCASPYDYCGPVWSGDRCKTCNPDYRAGSIIGGGAATEAPVAVVESGVSRAPLPPSAPTGALRLKPVEEPTPAVDPSAPGPTVPPSAAGASRQKSRPAPAGTREGTTKLLSMEDRKVDGPPRARAAEPAAEATEIVEEPRPRATKPRTHRNQGVARWPSTIWW